MSTDQLNIIQNHQGIVLLLMYGHRCPPCITLKKYWYANNQLILNKIIDKLSNISKSPVIYLEANAQQGELMDASFLDINKKTWILQEKLQSIPSLIIIKDNKFIDLIQPTKYMHSFETMVDEIQGTIKMLGA